jgi:hypothetical protein
VPLEPLPLSLDAADEDNNDDVCAKKRAALQSRPEECPMCLEVCAPALCLPLVREAALRRTAHAAFAHGAAWHNPR